jgi:glycosyltransferase involved in cell wall biosynthesis
MIIIPTYNRADLVGRAIRSVLDQDYPNLGVLVVDDGSTDGTQATIEGFRHDPRVRSVRHPVNQGVTAAKNSGLDALTDDTDYFGILDSDDVLEPMALDRLMRAFCADGDVHSQVFGWCRDAATGAPTGRMPAAEGTVTFDDAISGRFTGEFWQLVRRRHLGSRRFDPRAAGGEASVWWPLLRDHPGWLIDAVVRIYDATGEDRVSLPRFTRAGANGKRWVYRSILAEVGREMRDAYPRRYGETMAELAKWAALAGNGQEARTAARAAVRHAPSIRSLLIYLMAWLPAGIVRRIAERRARMFRRRETSTAPDKPVVTT